ncbi:MAG: hypothetical protein NC453_16345 [Muribaculum sp.]|nr:hypothetical protein [Muribaculum sp.]
MDKETKERHSRILTKDLTRETLYNFFVNHYTDSIGVDELDKGDVATEKRANPSSKLEDVRYRTEKLLFLNLLMDSNLENQIEKRKNAKYDYLIGLLLFVSSNSNFNYGFGYFKESIISFDSTLERWCRFLNSVVLDINNIGEISFVDNAVIQCGGILRIEIKKDFINEVSINMENFSESFGRCGSKYNFDILVKENGKLIALVSGESDGSGKGSGLYRQISNLNDTFTRLSLNNESLINLTHGH